MSVEECEEYWANLPPLPGSDKLWKFLVKYKPIILSKPDANAKHREACEKGKMRWVQKHLHPTPQVILSTKKWKQARPDTILIDDFPKNTVPFEEAGGSAIVFTSADQTINELKNRFGFK